MHLPHLPTHMQHGVQCLSMTSPPYIFMCPTASCLILDPFPFTQCGEIVDLNLVRDKDTGKTMGFAFLAYEDQRSTVLAVDNLSGAKVAGRTVRVEHVDNYKKKKAEVGGQHGVRTSLNCMVAAGAEVVVIQQHVCDLWCNRHVCIMMETACKAVDHSCIGSVWLEYQGIG